MSAAWVWILDLRVAGRRRTYATAPIQLTEGGQPIPVRGGLSLSQVRRSGADAGASVELLAGEPWLAEYPLSRADAELSRVVAAPGQTVAWEARDVIVRDAPTAPQVGDRGEIVAFGLGEGGGGDDAVYPPPAAVVDLQTWPTAPDSAQGRPYPVVYGSPGQGRTTGIRWSRGSQAGAWLPVGTRITASARATPALPVVRSASTLSPVPWDPLVTITLTGSAVTRLLVSDGWVDADDVTIWTRYAESWWPYPGLAVTRGLDGRGRRVSWVVVPSGADYRPLRLGQEWWVAWEDGGGVLLDGGANGSGLGSVVTWWLARSSVPVDWPSVRGAASVLDRYQIDGYVDAPVEPTDWVRDRLGPYPVVILSVSGGFGLRPVRWRASASEARYSLVVGDGTVSREQAPTVTEVTGVGAIRVRAGWLASHGTWAIEATATLPGVGGREEVVEIPECWAAGQAEDLARYHLWRLAIPRHRVTLTLDAIRWPLADQDVIVVTDDRLGWDRRPCIVVAAPLPDGRWGEAVIETVEPVRAVASATTSVYLP